MCAAARLAPQIVGIGEQLRRRGLASIETHMNLAIEIAADDPAARDDEHREKSDIAIGRTEAEVAMIQDEQRPGDTQEHMDAKPTDRAAHPFE